MNKTEQAQQLRLAAELIETGHPFEVRHETSEKWLPSKGVNPASVVPQNWYLRPILATPPDNRPLHNPDNLTAEQVGLGYRLTLPGEWNPTQEYWHCTKQWKKAERLIKLDTFRLPLSVPWPAIPDPYAELKAAHATGKVIQWKFKNAAGWMDKLANFEEFPENCDFRIKPEPPPPGMRFFTHEGKEWTYHRPGDPMPCDGERKVILLREDREFGSFGTICGSKWDWTDKSIIGWRYAETTKTVELGPEDVPPGSILKANSWASHEWRSVGHVYSDGVLLSNCPTTAQWSHLMLEYQINRPRHRDADGNPTLWEPCHKTISPR